MTRYLIDVTQEIIDYGIPGSRTKCPVIMAIRKYIPLAEAGVCSIYIYTANRYLIKTCLSPLIAQDFIQQYDSILKIVKSNTLIGKLRYKYKLMKWKKNIKPFQFYIDI